MYGQQVRQKKLGELPLYQCLIIGLVWILNMKVKYSVRVENDFAGWCFLKSALIKASATKEMLKWDESWK